MPKPSRKWSRRKPTPRPAPKRPATQLLSAQGDVRQAELDARKNPLLPAIQARQNLIALEAAKNREHQAEQDQVNKKANAVAGIEIQKAAENKAKVAADTAQRTIDS